MTSHRERNGGAPNGGARSQSEQEVQLAHRRAEMHAAEGHAGSIPRGNQRPERQNIGQRRHEWERVLGH